TPGAGSGLGETGWSKDQNRAPGRLRRRHRVPQALARVPCDGDPDPPRAHPGRDRAPHRAVDYPAGPQPADGSGYTRRPVQIPDPRSRQQVHGGVRPGASGQWHAGHQDAGPLAPGNFRCGALCGNATPRMPRPPADLRRTAPPADPGRVHAARQRAPAAPGAGTATSAARARPGGRYDHPDPAQTGRPLLDQRVPESTLTGTEPPAQSNCASSGTAQAHSPVLGQRRAGPEGHRQSEPHSFPGYNVHTVVNAVYNHTRPDTEAAMAPQQSADADTRSLWFSPPGDAETSRRTLTRERVVAEALTVISA